MALGLVSPLLNRGVRSRWLASLPVAGSKMLTIDSNGDTSFQDIPVAAWGSITGTLSAQTDLQSALDGKLSLTGGTLTGGLNGTTGTFSGVIKGSRFNTGPYEDTTAAFSTYHTGGHYFAGASNLYTGQVIWKFRTGPGYILLNDAGNGCSIISEGANAFGGEFSVASGAGAIPPQLYNYKFGFRYSDAYLAIPLALGRQGTSATASNTHEGAWLWGEASDTFAQRRSTNAQRFNLYGTYTDASNYRRLYVSSTTAGAFTIGVEGAGTGVSGNTLSIASDVSVTSSNGAFTARAMYPSYLYALSSDLGTGIFGRTWKARFLGQADGILWLEGAQDSTGLTGIILSAGSTGQSVYLKRISDVGGLAIRNSSDSADSPITAGAGTFSGNVTVSSNGTVLSSNGLDIRGAGYGGTSLSLGPQSETSAYRATFATTMFGAASTFFTLSINDAGQSATAFRAGRSDIVSGIHSVLTGAHCTLSPTQGFAEQRNSTNAQTFRLYGTYTDTSNYRRLYVSSTTAGAFTLGVEGAGTGASGNTLTVPNAMSVNGTLTMTNTGGGGLGNIQITGGSWWLYAGGTIQARIFNVNGWYGMSDLSTGGLSFGSGHGISWGSGSLNVPASGSITGDLFLYRNAAGQLDIRGDSGLRVRNVANTADAPITAGAGTFSGNIQTTGYVQVGSDSARVRLTQNGISNLASGLQYNLISWTGGIHIDAIKISGYAYRGINIERVAGQGGQTWLTVNLEGNSAAFGDTPRQALDVRGNAIIDGNVVLHRSATSTSLQVHNTFTDASNYIRQSLSFTTYSSTVHAQLAAEGAGTGAVNVPFVITPRGTGAFILGPMPNGTATGGNARGANAIDLQTTRSAATQVASGTRAIAIGTSCTASAVNTIAIGRATASGGSSLAIGTDSATASGAGSIAIGFDSITASASCSVAIGASGASSTANCAIAIGSGTASRVNEVAWGFRHTAFDVRPGSFLLSATTTNNTATALQLQNIFGSSNFTTRTGVVLHGTLHVTGVKSDGSAVAIYTRRIVLKNVGGTITLVESQTIGTDYEDNALTDLTISATSPFFQVTGITGETWKWAAWFSPTCEIAY